MSLLNDLSKGKLLGHPIHVMLVHFPLGLFPVSLLFDVLSLLKASLLFAQVSFYTMAAGLFGAYAAALFGMWDFIYLPNEKVVWKKAIIHASINGCIVLVYTVLLALRYRHYPDLAVTTLSFVISNMLLNVLLIIGAYYGGDLILRHGIGKVENRS